MEPFIALLKYKNNRISAEELMAADNTIKHVEENAEDKSESVLQIIFSKNRGILKLMGAHEDDIDLYNNVMDTEEFGGQDFHDFYACQEDFFDNDIIWDLLDDDNKKMFNKLTSRRIFGNAWGRDEDMKKLIENFPSEMNELVSTYCDLRNEQMNNTARREINNQIDDVFNNFNFDLIGLSGVKISVKDLLILYIENHLQLKDIRGLFTKIFRADGRFLGGWWNHMYQFRNDDDFNVEEFNEKTKETFELILNKMSE